MTLLVPGITPERAADVVRRQFPISGGPTFLPKRLYPHTGTQAITQHITSDQTDEALREFLALALEGLK